MKNYTLLFIKMKALLFIPLMLCSLFSFGQQLTNSNSSNVPIPDASSSGYPGNAYKALTFSGMPSNATITSVSYSVTFYHTYQGDISVRLDNTSSGISSNSHIVVQSSSNSSSGSFTESGSTSKFNGMNPNQTFYMMAWDNAYLDDGYIDYLSITVYYSVPPTVSSVTTFPTNVILGQTTYYYINGQNLTSNMGFWVADAASPIELSGGSSTQRVFQATPSSTVGNKAGIVKDAPNGNTLLNFSINVTFPTPSQPNLSVQSSSQIQLSWSNISNAYNYRIYRSTSNNINTASVINGSGTSSTSYTDNGLNPNTTYYYWIKACQAPNSGSCSNYSSVASATTTQGNISVSSVTTFPTNVILGQQTFYYVNGQNLPTGLAFWVADAVNPTEVGGSSTQRVFQATPNFTVGNKAGVVKDASNNTLLNFSIDVTFPAPSQPTLTVQGSNQIDISWNSVPNAYNYIIYRSTSNNSNTPSVVTSTTSTSYSDVNLTANTTYYYWVEACQASNSGSCSGFSSVASATTATTQNCPPFTDLFPSDWWYTATDYLCSQGIVVGDGNTNFTTVRPTHDINRAELAKLAYVSLDLGNHPNITTALKYPNPFNDLQTAVWYHDYALALSYLEYGDGKVPFDWDKFNFYPSNDISRAHVTKVLLEAWKVNTNVIQYTFTDMASSHDAYEYMNAAYHYGIVTDNDANVSGIQVNPNANAIRAEVFVMLYRLLQGGNVSLPNFTMSDFYQPDNYTPENFGQFTNPHVGNFNFYTASGFQIASTGLPLTFDATYNSYGIDMIEEFYPIRPVGRNWSHTYNSYLIEVEQDINATNENRVVIALPNGGFQVYEPTGNSFALGTGYQNVTVGLYSEMNKITSTKYEIKTKNHIIFTYEKLSGTNTDFPFVLTKITDRNNNQIQIQYQAANTSGEQRIYRVRSTGATVRYLNFYYYSNSDLLQRVSDPLSRNVYFYYDNTSDENTARITSTKNAINETTTYNYSTLTGDERYLIETILLPKGNTIDPTYDGKKLLSIQTNGNTILSYARSPNFGTNGLQGTTAVITDDSGFQTTTTFNKDGLLEASSDNNTIGSITYDVTHTTKPSSVTVNSQTTSYQYNAKGDVTQISLPEGITHQFQYTSYNDLQVYTDPRGKNYNYGYDGSGNLTSVATPRGTTTIGRNGDGTVSSTTSPEGVSYVYGYDNYGNVTSMANNAEGISSAATYDAGSRLLTYTQPNNQTVIWTYDNNNNVLTEQLNYITQFGYNANENQTSITNAKGVSTALTYDFDQDYLTQTSFEGMNDVYTYDNDGRMVTYTDPSGTSFSYTYNNKNQLISIVGGGKTIAYEYDIRNNLTKVTYDGSYIEFFYDGADRIIKTRDIFGNFVEYTYDLASNIETIKYETGKVVTYTYADDNLLATVKDWNNNTTSYTYRDDGLLDQTTYPNGTICHHEYDNAARLTKMFWIKTNGDTINAYHYGLDAMSNIVSETRNEPLPFPMPTAGTQTFTYNNTNQVQGSSNGFDNDGNQTSVNNNTYQYDEQDRLITALGNQFVYDGLGHRRSKTKNGVVTRYILDIVGMSKVLMETDASGTVQNHYVYGHSLISRIGSNGTTTHYYHGDSRGSVIAMTDANETTTHEYAYGAYGEVVNSTEPDFNPFQYVGQYGVMYDEADLYFMRARYYNSLQKRFLTEDPVWSPNLYSYVDGNPIGYSDPLGTFKWKSGVQGAVIDATLEVWNQTEKIGNGIAGGIIGIQLAIDEYNRNGVNGDFTLANSYLENGTNDLIEAELDIVVAGVQGFVGGKKKKANRLKQPNKHGTIDTQNESNTFRPNNSLLTHHSNTNGNNTRNKVINVLNQTPVELLQKKVKGNVMDIIK